MALTPTATEARCQALGTESSYVYVEIQDADGVWRDLTTLMNARSAVVSVELGRHVDSPLTEARVMLWRNERAWSLAHGMTASRLNRNAAGSYAPLLEINRSIRIRTATVPKAYRPVEADKRLVFSGYIKSTNVAAGDTQIEVTAQAGIGVLNRRIIKVDRKYGGSGQTIETVAPAILSDNGLGAHTLWFPAALGWGFPNEGTVPKGTPVFEALMALIIRRGGVLRERMNPGMGAWQSTIYVPNYTNTTVHHTFAAGRVISRAQFVPGELDDIRNSGLVSFPDRATGTRLTVSAQDSASMALFGEAYFEIIEGDGGATTSASEANTLLSTTLLNTAVPRSSHQVTVPYRYQVELDDLCSFLADGMHFDTDQTAYVIGYRHIFPQATEEGVQRPVTELTLRGKPAGAYTRYLTMARPPAPDAGVARIDVPVVTLSGTTYTVSVTGNVHAATLVREEWSGSAWVNQTQFSASGSGSYTWAASATTTIRHRVAPKNAAGQLDPAAWREVLLGPVQATAGAPSYTVEPTTITEQTIEYTVAGSIGPGGVAPVQARIEKIDGSLAQPGDDWSNAPKVRNFTRAYPPQSFRVRVRDSSTPTPLEAASVTIPVDPPLDGDYVDGSGRVTGTYNPGSGGGGSGSPGVTPGGQIAISAGAFNGSGQLTGDIAGGNTVVNGHLYVASAQRVRVGTAATPASVRKTMRIEKATLAPRRETTKWWYQPSAGLTPGQLSTTSEFSAPLILPVGCTLVNLRARVNRANTSETVSVSLQSVNDTGGASGLGSTSLEAGFGATGWQTLAIALSHAISQTLSYEILVSLASSASTSLTPALSWLEAEYDVPDYLTSL